jgi:hypothetical protein
MFRMKFSIHGRDATTVYGQLTRRAQAATLQMIMYFTIGHVVVFVEARRVKGHSTFLLKTKYHQHKVLRVNITFSTNLLDKQNNSDANRPPEPRWNFQQSHLCTVYIWAPAYLCSILFYQKPNRNRNHLNNSSLNRPRESRLFCDSYFFTCNRQHCWFQESSRHWESFCKRCTQNNSNAKTCRERLAISAI